MSEQEVLTLIWTRLSTAFDLRRLILFGSRTKATATEESDWDVLVVADSEIPFIERQGRALVALGKRDFPVDLLVYTPHEAAREAQMIGSAVYWAEREGRVFYAK